MKKVLAILLAVVLVSFTVPAYAGFVGDIDASLTIEQPSNAEGCVFNYHDTSGASQTMLDLSIESLNLSWGPVFPPPLDANITISEDYTVTGTSDTTADADADANANATGDSDADATATTNGEGDGVELAGAGALSGSGALAGAGALAGIGSESEMELDGQFNSDADIDIDLDWSNECCNAGELQLDNVVVLFMNQSGGHTSLVGASASMEGNGDLDLEANNAFQQMQVQRPQYDTEGILVAASGVQQQTSQSITNLTITSNGSVPVLDGSLTTTDSFGL
jgi:hypothetical protein